MLSRIAFLATWLYFTLSRRSHTGFLLKMSSLNYDANVAIDKDGNIIVGGVYCSVPATLYDSTYIPIDAITLSIDPSSCGMFLAKYTWNGIRTWIVKIQHDTGYSGNVWGGFLATDSIGNIAVAGQYFPGRVAVYDSTNAKVATINKIGAYGNSILVVFDPNGYLNFVARQDGTSDNDGPVAVAFDSWGSVYVFGSYLSYQFRAYDADSTSNYVSVETSITGYGSNSFLAKYSPVGLVQWMIRIDGTSWDNSIRSLNVDTNDNVFFGSEWNSPSVTIYGRTNQISQTRVGNIQSTMVKMDTYGTLLWSIQVQGVSSTDVAVIRNAATDSSGGLVVGGRFETYTSNQAQVRFVDSNGHVQGTINYPGSFFGFVARFNSTGHFQWSVLIDGIGNSEEVSSVTVDQQDNVLVGGLYQSTVLRFFAPNNGSETHHIALSDGGSRNLFTARLNATGYVQWVAHVGSTAATSNDDIGRVATDSDGNVYIAAALQSPNAIPYDASGQRLVGANYLWSQGMYVIKFLPSGTWLSYFNLTDTPYSLATTMTSTTITKTILSTTPSTRRSISALRTRATPDSNPELDGDGNTSPGTAQASSASFAIGLTIGLLSALGFGFGLFFLAREMRNRAVLNEIMKHGVRSVVSTTRTSSHVKRSQHTEAETRSTKPISHGGTQFSYASSDKGSAYQTVNEAQVTNMATALVTTHELSIPVFLELKWGLDYVQGSFLTKGGGGELYLCSALNSSVAAMSHQQPLIVKRVADNFGQLTEQAKAGFWQEVSMMWKFRDHRFFAKLYGYSMAPACMLMKYYEMGDLADWITGKGRSSVYPYTKWRLVKIYKEFVSAIWFMHAQGLLHSDIKPANVLLDIDAQTRDMFPVVTDFGISRVVSDAAMLVKAFERSNLRGLSISYAAPEVLFCFRQRIHNQNAVVLAAGDVFSLAVTLLAMLNRRDPWK